MKFNMPRIASALLLVTPAALAQQVQFNHLETITTAEGEAEIVVFDVDSKRLFVTDAENGELDIFQTSGIPGAALTPLASVVLGGAPNSVAVKNGLVAVAVEGPTKQDPGMVEFYDVDGAVDGASVTTGALPDMLTFTPDGTKVLVANEGEADEATGLINPEGSVTIVDVSTRTATTASFAALNGNKAALQAAGVRLSDTNGITLAQDVEPEYITIDPTGTTAFVVLQEANSVALVDIASSTVSEIRPLGGKDHSLLENQFDASNQDGIDGNFITANVLGLYMPDAITSFTVGGTLYYATANEGDGRDDFSGFEDETRGEDLAGDFALDVEEAVPDTGLYSLADLNDTAVLGRLKFATSDYDLARGDTDNDGDVDQLFSFGARSVTIWDAASGAPVFDSGDDFEQLMLTAGLFDDGRSDDKGPEPEAVTFGEVNGTPLLFVGLERTNAVVVYDISSPANASYLGLIDLAAEGAVSPEGLAFVAAANSPTGLPLLAISSEVSGSVSLYEVVLSNVGDAFCFGDGSGTACPCASGATGEGCPNSSGAGAILSASGTANLSNDSLVLTVSQTPASTFGLFFAGSAQQTGGSGELFGNGLRCVATSIQRLEVVATGFGAVSSTQSISVADSLNAPQTRHYQFWFRDIADQGCSSTFNTSNGLSIDWEL